MDTTVLMRVLRRFRPQAGPDDYHSCEDGAQELGVRGPNIGDSAQRSTPQPEAQDLDDRRAQELAAKADALGLRHVLAEVCSDAPGTLDSAVSFCEVRSLP